MSDLEQENLRLKRELAEAQMTVARPAQSVVELHAELRDNQEHFNGIINNLRAQLLALSASYQRQKEALERLYNYQAQRSSPDTAWDEPMMRNARAALAETPDVSMWQSIDSAPKDGTAFIGKCGRLVFRTHWQAYNVYEKKPEGGHEVTGQRYGWSCEDTDSHFPMNPTHWIPLSTLQPDHQK